RGDESDHQGYASAVEHPREEVASERVGAEPVRGSWRCGAEVEILIAVALRHPRTADAEQREHDQHNAARNRQVSLAQAGPRVPPERRTLLELVRRDVGDRE